MPGYAVAIPAPLSLLERTASVFKIFADAFPSGGIGRIHRGDIHRQRRLGDDICLLLADNSIFPPQWRASGRPLATAPPQDQSDLPAVILPGCLSNARYAVFPGCPMPRRKGARISAAAISVTEFAAIAFTSCRDVAFNIARLIDICAMTALGSSSLEMFSGIGRKRNTRPKLLVHRN